ncbi:tripartite tricarboxylate transporter TctB family protein [Roseicitreum antarcticum]|uniref:Tripartite tricarboxylate transporter TctB family protein n=1 Tax=Roseicitreum antarcticum TaxID=564137 RepID=A0A1H2U0G2_9RHOB|nr:tripartite tricarboxylate transporter TctB family protein [Roseicitreum antarcticum]SDW49541.1 Tripartite tricarboxylate transporter TctB family protein [Roseicitreum antarcticum]
MTTVFERAAVALALFLTAAAMMASIGWSDASGMQPAFSPEFFPRIILSVLLVLTAAGFVAECIRKGGTSAVELVHTAVLTVALLVFAWAMMRFGFFLTAVSFSVIVLWMLGLRNPLVIALYALAVPGALVGLFNHVLIMPLPTSPFTYLF